MKILILTHSYPDITNSWRGSFIKDQVNALSLNNTIVVVYFKLDYSTVNPFGGYKFIKEGSENLSEYTLTITRSLPVINQANYLIQAYRFIGKEILPAFEPDVIHSHLAYPAGFLGAVIRNIKKTPVLLTEHSRISNYFRSWFHKQCVRYAFRNSDCIVAVSSSLKNEIVSTSGRTVKIVYNFVDTGRFEISENNGSVINIGFLGGLGNNNKGLDLLLHAVLGLQKNFILHIGGSGLLLADYKQLAMELGIEEKCRFYGDIPRGSIAEFYSGLNIFVLPSRYETFGIVLIEAMACGLPVIATQCGGPEEIVTDSTGILIEKDNIPELTAALKTVSEKLPTFNKMEIRKYTEEKFGKQAFIDRISNAYNEILKPDPMATNKTYSKDVRHLYTETYFMENATGHDEFRVFDGKFENLIDKFQMVIRLLDLKESDSLLDIGCGRGELVIHHALNGGRSTGADFSAEAISLAREKATELKADCIFITDSFENIDENINYDKIVSLDFIEHISSDEAELFFKKCYRLLNPGGRLVIYTFPNTIRRIFGYKLLRAYSLLKRKPLPRREPDTVSDHYKQYHLNEQNYFTLKKSAKVGGFSKVRVLYYDPSIEDSAVKSLLVNTPARHLFLKGLTLVAYK